MTTAERYVTAAYLVVLAAVLLYVVIYSFKLARLGREVEELSELARGREDEGDGTAPSTRGPSARLTRQ